MPPKLHHYVPQFLQRNFRAESPGNEPVIHCFDKSNGKSFCAPIRKSGGESRFNAYVDEEGNEWSAEDKFGVVENYAAPVVNKLVASRRLGSLSDDEIGALAVFIHIQNGRTKAHRSSMQALPELMLQALTEHEVDVSALRERYGPLPGEEDTARLSIEMGFGNMNQIAPIYVEGKAWLLLQSRGKPFYLGDHPITKRNRSPERDGRGNLGILCEGIEIYMPLSPNLCLAVWCVSNLERSHARLQGGSGTLLDYEILEAYEQDQPLMQNSRQVSSLNFLQMYYAERFVFSQTGDWSLAQEIMAMRPELKEGGPRPVIWDPLSGGPKERR